VDGRYLCSRLPLMADSRDRSVVASALMTLACLVLGLLAGGMLVIGVAFVSFWKSSHRPTFRGGSRRIPTSSAG
jgi:hypothetical protein